MTPELLAAAKRVIQANRMLQYFCQPDAPQEPEGRVMFDLDRRKAVKECVAAEDSYNKLLDGVE